jgi:hypothetical protein
MTAIFFGILTAMVWTAGLADWIVAYATGLTQLGIWVTALSLVPFGALWVSLKTDCFSQMPVSSTRAHWSLLLK